MQIEDFRAEYSRYRSIGEKALAQVSDDGMNAMPAADANSMAMIARHVSGNFISRFGDFLTSDGEKPGRDREAEFEIRRYTRAEVEDAWRRGWGVVEDALKGLTDGDMSRTVTIRSQPHTVHQALTRSLAHVAYHVGQIVLLARMNATSDWQSMSIPRGQSEAFNRAMTGGR